MLTNWSVGPNEVSCVCDAVKGRNSSVLAYLTLTTKLSCLTHSNSVFIIVLHFCREHVPACNLKAQSLSTQQSFYVLLAKWSLVHVCISKTFKLNALRSNLQYCRVVFSDAVTPWCPNVNHACFSSWRHLVSKFFGASDHTWRARVLLSLVLPGWSVMHFVQQGSGQFELVFSVFLSFLPLVSSFFYVLGLVDNSNTNTAQALKRGWEKKEQ